MGQRSSRGWNVANKKSFTSYEQVSRALENAGVESSNLIIGIDYTKSNLIKGRRTFPQGDERTRGLHTIKEDLRNPYQNVIEIVGRSLEHLDDDKLIPAYGFGSLQTKGHAVFPFLHDTSSMKFCHTFGQVLEVYNRITPVVQLSGPTNFAPLIRRALEIVKRTTSAEFHILVIVADGQVDVEWETIDAIREASQWPLSIITVGVGDGPWKTMAKFDDTIRGRAFDNFNFVEYDRTMREAQRKGVDSRMYFALQALQEIPPQYRAMKALGLIGKRTGSRGTQVPDHYLPTEVKPELMPVPSAISSMPSSVPMGMGMGMGPAMGAGPAAPPMDMGIPYGMDPGAGVGVGGGPTALADVSVVVPMVMPYQQPPAMGMNPQYPM